MTDESKIVDENKSSTFKRRSALEGSYAALKYLSKVPRNKFRRSDRITDLIVGLCILLGAMLIFAPAPALKAPLILLLDLSVFAAVIAFLMQRLGILTSLSDRQAALVCDIILGVFVLGVILCLNIMVAINFLTHSQF